MDDPAELRHQGKAHPIASALQITLRSHTFALFPMDYSHSTQPGRRYFNVHSIISYTFPLGAGTLRSTTKSELV